MKTYKRRSVWRSKFYALSAFIFAASFIAASLLTTNGFAASKIFIIKNAQISNKTEDVTASIASFNDSAVVTDTSFNNLGDSVTYRISIKNSDSTKHTIYSISDNNKNSAIAYSYDKHTNFTVGAGENFNFDVTAKYATAVSDAALYLDTVFTISYDGGKASFGVVPNTYDDIIPTQ
ncbi:hypothetical protein IK110_01775 [Candidatus Saccharibacteria bacterium]|nr:hypothetical protein [Candidatus Saccharibacteria bacterium]